MTSAFWLGVRLSIAGGWRRPLSMTLVSALGTVLLLAGLALPGALTADDPLSPQRRLTVVTILTAIGVPVALLLLAVNRLSAQIRDQRLARLRLLGVPADGVRVVAATENAAFALAGAILGAVAFAGSAGPLSRVLMERLTWVLHPLSATPPLLLSGIGLVVVLAAAVSLAPHRTISSTGLTGREEGERPPPSPVRLVPLVVGLAVTAWVATRRVPPDSGPDERLLVLFLFGALLTAVGMVVSLGLVAGALAGLLGRVRPGPTLLLAARRQTSEPTSTVRLVTGLLMAIFVVTFAMAPLAAFENTVQYAAVTEIEASGPQRTSLRGESPAPASAVAGLTGVPGVLGVEQGIEDGDIATCGSGTDPAACGNIAVLPCAAATRVYGLPSCRDDRATFARLDPHVAASGADSLRVTHAGGSSTLPAAVVDVDASVADVWQMGPAVIVIPPALAASAHLPLAPGGVDVWTDASGRADAAVADWAHQHSLDAFSGWRLTWDELQGMRALVRGVAAVILGLGLLTVLIVAVDRAVERRRAVARLVAVGVPPRVLRGAQLLQTALSLLPGLVLAVAGGIACGYAYVNLGGGGQRMPWESWTVVAAVAGIGSLVVALATVAGVGARLRPDSLRRE